MASVNETNIKRFMEKYRVEPRAHVSRQNPKLRVIVGGEGKDFSAVGDSGSADNMTDRVMAETADSFPFQIIEGGKTEETINDRKVRVIPPLAPKGIFYVVWQMINSEKPVNSGMSLLDRIKKIF